MKLVKWCLSRVLYLASVWLYILFLIFSLRKRLLFLFSEMFQYVAIAYKDGSVKLVKRSNFMPMTTTNLDMGIDIANGEKRRRVIPYMVYMQQTFTGIYT